MALFKLYLIVDRTCEIYANGTVKTFSGNFISDVLTSGQNYVATVDGEHDDSNTDPCKFALKVHTSNKNQVSTMSGIIDQKETSVQIIDQKETSVQLIDQKETFIQIIDQKETSVQIIDQKETSVQIIDQKETFVPIIDQKETFVQIIDQKETFVLLNCYWCDPSACIQYGQTCCQNCRFYFTIWFRNWIK